jgi:hypothetical protein
MTDADAPSEEPAPERGPAASRPTDADFDELPLGAQRRAVRLVAALMGWPGG